MQLSEMLGEKKGKLITEGPFRATPRCSIGPRGRRWLGPGKKGSGGRALTLAAAGSPGSQC